MSRITVVIPCYNYGRFLEEAVDSVLAQSRQDFEIVVVDDGSTEEGTCSLLESFERPKTTVLRTENQGPAAARNTGIKASSGEYVVSLDADDRLHPQFLEKTAALLDSDDEGKVGFVTTWLRRFGDDNGTLDAGDGSPVTLAMANNIHASALFRRQAWEKVGGYREFFTGWEDWNLWLNIASKDYRWEVVPEELFFYRKHGKTRSSRSMQNREKLFDAVFKDNADFYLKYHAEIIKAYFQKLATLENIWHEKDSALADNEKLALQLEQALEGHKESTREYLRLEDYCHGLLEKLEKAEEERQKAAQEYRRLEEYCHLLEKELGVQES